MNGIKSYSLTFTPQNGGWDSSDHTYTSTFDEPQSSVNFNLRDVDPLGDLYPETTYSYSGTVTDIFDNVSQIDENQITTLNDYPSFFEGIQAKLPVAESKSTIDEDTSKLGVYVDDTKITPSITSNENVEVSQASDFSCLPSSMYAEYEENDWDWNGGWKRKRHTSSGATNTAVFNRYTDRLIGFTVHNRKLGMYTISAKINNAPLQEQYKKDDYTTVGETAFDSADIKNAEYPFEGYDGSGIYHSEDNERNSISLYIGNLKNSDIPEEGNTLVVEAVSCGKNGNSLSTSTLTIPFVSYKKPEASFYGRDDVTSTDIVGFNNIPFGLSEGNKIKVSTHKSRVFIPLKHFGDKLDNNILDTKINSLSGSEEHDNYYYKDFAGYKEAEGLTNGGAKLIVQASVSNPDAEEVILQGYDSAEDATDPVTAKWKTIGIEHSNDTDTEYDTERIYGYDNLWQFAQMRDDSDRKIAIWPKDNDHYFDGLIPGKYYGFRVICSNRVGTTVAAHAYQTTPAQTPVFESSAYIGQTPLGDVITINPGTEVSFTGSVSNAGGTEVHNEVMSIVTSGPSPVLSGQPTEYTVGARVTFDSIDDYTVTVSSPTRYIMNSEVEAVFSGNVKSKTYIVHVIAQDSLTLNNPEASDITTNSATVSGSYTTTGSTTVSATSFRYKKNSETEWSSEIAGRSVTSPYTAALTGLTAGTLYDLETTVTYRYTGDTIDRTETKTSQFTTESQITPNIDISNTSRTSSSITITLQ